VILDHVAPHLLPLTLLIVSLIVLWRDNSIGSIKEASSDAANTWIGPRGRNMRCDNTMPNGGPGPLSVSDVLTLSVSIYVAVEE
jgi:hypothetical protein